MGFSLADKKGRYFKIVDVSLQVALIGLAGYALHIAESLAAALVFIFLTLSVWQMISSLILFVVNRKKVRSSLRRFYEKTVLICITFVIVSVVADREDILLTAICVNLVLTVLYVCVSLAELRSYYKR